MIWRVALSDASRPSGRSQPVAPPPDGAGKAKKRVSTRRASSGGCGAGSIWRAGEGHVKLWVALFFFAVSASLMRQLLVRTDLNDIQILPAGRRHPQATELLASERMSAVVKELATRLSSS